MNNKFINKITVLSFVSILFFSQFTKADAQNSLSDSEVRERLNYINNSLIDDKSSGNLWWYSWVIGYSTATIGQGAVYFYNNEKNVKQDMALGAATTFLGAVGQIMDPMLSGKALKLLSEMPETTSGQREKKLIKAEELLKKSALREKRGKSWQIHALTGAVNLSGGLVVWLGYKRSIGEGLLNFLINSAVTEIQIWSQPVRAVNDYDNYIHDFESEHTLGYCKPKMKMFVSSFPGGIQISFAF
ncbi:hypothetical protein J7K93_05445 [bacterium]|nr:hypothetical protein [bacterium]